ELGGSAQQVVLDRLEGAVGQVVARAVGVPGAILRQVVGEVDHADTQGTALHGCPARGLDRVVLVVQQRVQRAYRELGQLFQLVEAVDCPQIQGRQGAQGDLAVGVVHAF